MARPLLSLLLPSARRAQTLESFDFQWGHLPDGDAMPSDPWFAANLPAIIEEITALPRAWFRGKRVLDAGCGQGRWTRGLLGLGARVTAVDFSEAGLARTREACAGLDGLETRRVDLLRVPDDLAARRFDLVFSFGVLHHTGDLWGAVRNVAALVDDGGLLFLYLYGSRSWDLRKTWRTRLLRARLAGLPFDRKVEEIRRRHPELDVHQAFDLLSPTINDRTTAEEVRARLRALGLPEAVETLRSGEVWLLAGRPGALDRAGARRDTPARSFFTEHYAEVDRLRRDLRREAAAFALEPAGAPPAPRGASAPESAVAALGAGDGRAALLLATRPGPWAAALASAGWLTTVLAPGGRPADLDPGVDVIESALRAEPPPGRRFDVAVLPGAAVQLGPSPADSLAAIPRWLRPGAAAWVEVLAPEPVTVGQRAMKALFLRAEPLRRAQRVLRWGARHGLVDALRFLDGRLPRRLEGPALRAALEAAGAQVAQETRDGPWIRVRATFPGERRATSTT